MDKPKEPPPPAPPLWRRVWPDVAGGIRTLFNTALFVAVVSFGMAQFAPNDEISAATLDKALHDTSGRVVLYFWQPKCPGCEHMNSFVAELEAKGRDVKVIRINALANPALAARYEVRGTPTLLIVRQGATIGRNDGPFAERYEFVSFAGSAHLR